MSRPVFCCLTVTLVGESGRGPKRKKYIILQSYESETDHSEHLIYLKITYHADNQNESLIQILCPNHPKEQTVIHLFDICP